MRGEAAPAACATETARDLARVVAAAFAREIHGGARESAIEIDADRGTHLVRCSLDDQSPAGRCPTAVEFRVDFARSDVWICDVWVAPSCRGRGMGTRLTRVVEMTARELGIHRVRLLPLRGAEGFWRALGYTSAPSPVRALMKRW